jgi:fructose-1,6-bisphosphatase I
MSDQPENGNEVRIIRVPESSFSAACEAYAARFGLSEEALYSDDIMMQLLRWVTERPAAWRCDHCREPIANAAEGGFQWRFFHATGAVDNVQIVHNGCARQSQEPRKPMLQVVGAETLNPDHGVDTKKVWTVLPLHHLTDDDGLVQLLDIMLANRLPQETMLAILQRLHVRNFDRAGPYLAGAMRDKRFNHNLSNGLYWQGDLEEALRSAPESGEELVPKTAEVAAGECSLSEHVLGSDVPRKEALAELLDAVALAGVEVAARTARAPLDFSRFYDGPMGGSDTAAERMDSIANAIFIETLRKCAPVAALVSEEVEAPVPFPGNEPAPFLVALDPLDGSDNTNFGMITGAIFAVLPRHRVGIPEAEEFLRPASDLVVSGYMIFGSAVQLVLELCGSVAIFAYDSEQNVFVRRKAAHRMPETVATLSVNEANSAYWPQGFTEAMTHLHAMNAGEDRQFISRFSGAMVADIHRILMTGGIFAVPGDTRRPEGKLRQIYECNPISRIFKAAGGAASAGTVEITNLSPCDLHQRSPFFVGTPSAIRMIEKCYKSRA